MEVLRQDLRYAVRTLARSPVFTAAAVVTLALGIGANTAIFSVLDAALLRPMPVVDPGRLVQLQDLDDQVASHHFSHPAYLAIRDEGAPFSGVLAHGTMPMAGRLGELTETLNVGMVSTDFFDVLGLDAALGRHLMPFDDDAREVAVISHGLWQRRFGGRPDVVGQTLVLNGSPFTIVGVAPARFAGLVRGAPHDLWAPLAATAPHDCLGSPRIACWEIIARLRPSESVEDAESRMGVITARLRDAELLGSDRTIRFEPAARGITYGVLDLDRTLLLMQGAAGLVLLIGCANLASLLLARAMARRRELAVRMAIGASRARIARQWITEALVLVSIGGILGVLVAGWAAAALTQWPTPVGTVAIEPVLDWRVLGVAFALTAAAGLLFAIGPAIRAARADPTRGLKNGSDGSGARAGSRRVLVVGQVAISLTLVTGAVLLGRSLLNLQRVEIGYIARHALLATVDLSAAGSSAQERNEFVNRFLERVRSLPGVAEATVASKVPPSPVGGVLRLSAADLQGVAVADDIIAVDIDMVGEAYFSVLGLPILRGRGFTEADAAGAPPVVIINEFMARRYWPGEDPIGRRILDWEIVGVAGDVKARSLRESERYGIWRPFRQSSPVFVTLIARTAGDPLSLAGAIRDELRAMHPDIALADVRSLEEHVARASSQERLAARVAGGFSLLALLLAAIGLYGLLAYLISRRRREIGVRLAIGAGAEDISRLVMSDGLRLTATGVALGIPVALLCGRLVESLAFEVDARDAGSFGLAAALLLGIGAAAAYLPARRAAAVDPTAALRED